MVNAGQTFWQTLPLGDIGPGNSPYMSSSAFAGNILLIDLFELAEQGWLDVEDLTPNPKFCADRIDYSLLHSFRVPRLRRAAQAFFTSDDKQNKTAYFKYCDQERYWLDDYALFMTLNASQNGLSWSKWPTELARRDPQALSKVSESCNEEIGFWKFCQWSFARQWSKLKRYAVERGVRIIGDVPIFVAYQSSDVWAHQDLFELDENGSPIVVAGVPPDYFSETGQLWGNPLYRWSAHERTGFNWWIARMRHALKQSDIVRIDHFRGFASYWEIPAGESTAMNGKWVPGPGAKLFQAFQDALGQLPIIAEDLGVITPDVVELREQFNLPGMRILQFAFGEDESHYFLPHHYVPNSVAYTGTHDNDTSVGWWNTATHKEREFAQKYLDSSGNQIHWDMIKAVSCSEANTVIIPMQDVLGLEGDHRMNFPGQNYDNWEWRFSWDQVSNEYTEKLVEITGNCERKFPAQNLSIT